MSASPSRRRVLTSALALTAVGCAPGAGRTAWTAYDPASQSRVDHRSWQLFLDRNTRARGDDVTLVDYGGVPTVDRELLDDYVRTLEEVPTRSLARREQLAFWLNLHNALAVRLVLDNLIVTSIDDIRGRGLFAARSDRLVLARVEGLGVSLSAIRGEVLGPVFQDPRWHYGLCDATIGGPSLSRQAFTGASVDRALETAAIDYVGHPRAVRIDSDTPGTLLLNALWRRGIDDFGGSLQGVYANIALYADAELRAHLASAPSVTWVDDRRLNEFGARPA